MKCRGAELWPPLQLQLSCKATSVLTWIKPEFSLKMCLMSGEWRHRFGGRGGRLGINVVLMAWWWSAWNQPCYHPLLSPPTAEDPRLKFAEWQMQVLNAERCLVLKTVCVRTWCETRCKLCTLTSLERCDYFGWSYQGKEEPGQEDKWVKIMHPMPMLAWKRWGFQSQLQKWLGFFFPPERKQENMKIFFKAFAWWCHTPGHGSPKGRAALCMAMQLDLPNEDDSRDWA